MSELIKVLSNIFKICLIILVSFKINAQDLNLEDIILKNKYQFKSPKEMIWEQNTDHFFSFELNNKTSKYQITKQSAKDI